MMIRRLFGGPGGLEIVVCIIGLLASLIPAVVYTDPFWGVKSFVDKEWFSKDPPGVVVTQIDQGSPVDSAGVRPHDHIISLNGQPVQFHRFRDDLTRVEPGEIDHDSGEARRQRRALAAPRRDAETRRVAVFRLAIRGCACFPHPVTLANCHATDSAVAAVAGDRGHARRPGDRHGHNRSRGHPTIKAMERLGFVPLCAPRMLANT
jgi:hypothetical protein